MQLESKSRSMYVENNNENRKKNIKKTLEWATIAMLIDRGRLRYYGFGFDTHQGHGGVGKKQNPTYTYKLFIAQQRWLW